MTRVKAGDELLVSTPEAGRRLGITTRQVYDLIDAGDLAAYRTDDGPRVPLTAIRRRLIVHHLEQTARPVTVDHLQVVAGVDPIEIRHLLEEMSDIATVHPDDQVTLRRR